MIRRVVQSLVSRFLRPTAVTISGLRAGQQPHVSVEYGRWIALEFDLPVQAEMTPHVETVLGRAFGASRPLSQETN